jgi:ferredoxin-NADP reductase
MWRELLSRGDASSISVIYSVRSPQELAFLEELQSLERRRAIRFEVTITGDRGEWTGGRGRLTARLLEAHLVTPGDTRCAVSGPAAFVADVGQLLLGLGVPPRHVVTEKW